MFGFEVLVFASPDQKEGARGKERASHLPPVNRESIGRCWGGMCRVQRVEGRRRTLEKA